MTDLDTGHLIYDWNERHTPPPYELKLNDETLRDGLQSPSIADPPIGDKLKILHLMENLGIYSADIGLPGAGPQATKDALALAKEIGRSIPTAPREPWRPISFRSSRSHKKRESRFRLPSLSFRARSASLQRNGTRIECSRRARRRSSSHTDTACP